MFRTALLWIILRALKQFSARSELTTRPVIEPMNIRDVLFYLSPQKKSTGPGEPVN